MSLALLHLQLSKCFLQPKRVSDTSSLFLISVAGERLFPRCCPYRLQLRNPLGHFVAASWGTEGPSNYTKQQEGRHGSCFGDFSLEFDMGGMQGGRGTGFLHLHIPPLLSAGGWTWDPQEEPSAPCSREDLKDVACGVFFLKEGRRKLPGLFCPGLLNANPALPSHRSCNSGVHPLQQALPSTGSRSREGRRDAALLHRTVGISYACTSCLC